MIQVNSIKSAALKEVFFFFTLLFFLVFSTQLHAQSGWKKNAAGHDVYIYKPEPVKPYKPTPRERIEYTPKVNAIEPAKFKTKAPVIEEKKAPLEANRVEKQYYKSGGLELESPFVNGLLHGIRKQYYENGALLLLSPYINGEQNGIEKQYDQSGQISSEIPFTNGNKNGVVKFYRENGQLWFETPYVNGIKHGISKHYHANGKLASAVQMTKDQASGIGKWYYESGKLRRELTYIDGRANGIQKEYYENGKLEKQTLYKNDEVVKKEPPKPIINPPLIKVTDPKKSNNIISGSNTVKINNLVWMNQNLDVSTFRNGDSIPEAKTAKEWQNAIEQNKPACCYYNNDQKNKKYGRLYNHSAVIDARGLAPTGWHIASDEEWTSLTSYLGTLAQYNPWRTENVFKKNESGFNDLLSGKRSQADSFENMGSFSYWWSLSKWDEYTAYVRTSSENGSVLKNHGLLVNGLSVRCIKN